MNESKKVKQGKRFVFTLNNYTEEEVRQLKELNGYKDKIRYITWQQERGAEGTVHIQGFVVWKTAVRIVVLKKFIGRAHFENAYGSTEQNVEYCTKKDTRLEGTEPWTWGELPKSKKEQGLDEEKRWRLAFEAAKEGRLDDIPADIQYRHFGNTLKIQTYYQDQKKKLEDVSGVWVQGKTGVGKSTFVEYLFGKSVYWKMGTKWFDGYQGERAIVFDDLSLKHREFGYLLKIWADRRAFQAEIKGASIKIRPLLFVVTSQYAIEQIWGSDEETKAAIRRRFRVIELKKDMKLESIGEHDDVLLVTSEALDAWNAKIKAEEMGEVKEELQDKSLKSLLELPGRGAAPDLGVEHADLVEDGEDKDKV